MRTNIEIDDALISEVMQSTGAKTKREAVDASLRQTVQLKRQGAALKALWGIGEMDPDYDYKKMRVSDKWNRASVTRKEAAAQLKPDQSGEARRGRKQAA
jgi:Arc/MetJ family transcription regulator